jgi:hypothetical protein
MDLGNDKRVSGTYVVTGRETCCACRCAGSTPAELSQQKFSLLSQHIEAPA